MEGGRIYYLYRRRTLIMLTKLESCKLKKLNNAEIIYGKMFLVKNAAGGFLAQFQR